MLIDLRHLLRNLRRSPASATAAFLTLSLTLGAGASIFAVVDAVLLTPPPFADPEALVTLGELLPDDRGAAPRSVRYETFEGWRERAGSRAAIEGYDPTNLTLTGLGAAEGISVTLDEEGAWPTVYGLSWRPPQARCFLWSEASARTLMSSPRCRKKKRDSTLTWPRPACDRCRRWSQRRQASPPDAS